MLNTAQMCDVLHLHKFHIPPTHLDEPYEINTSVHHIINLRKKKKEDAEKQVNVGVEVKVEVEEQRVGDKAMAMFKMLPLYPGSLLSKFQHHMK